MVARPTYQVLPQVADATRRLADAAFESEHSERWL
jgi:hypothetical protein